jgi:hypothetical protein
MSYYSKKQAIEKITKFVLGGGVVIAEKVKGLQYGGKHIVSIGRYQEAIKSKNRFAVIYTGKRTQAHHTSKHFSLALAVREFVEFCGNDIAYNSYLESRNRE